MSRVAFAVLFAVSCGQSNPLKEILPIQVQRAWTRLFRVLRQPALIDWLPR